MKILFVCKSNVGRSQMAEVFLADLKPEHDITSAGTHVLLENEGVPISQLGEKVIATMDELGFNLRDKKMNKLTPELVDAVDKVIALNDKEELPGYLKNSPKLEVWDAMPDAAGTEATFHDRLRDKIREKVSELARKLD